MLYNRSCFSTVFFFILLNIFLYCLFNFDEWYRNVYFLSAWSTLIIFTGLHNYMDRSAPIKPTKIHIFWDAYLKCNSIVGHALKNDFVSNTGTIIVYFCVNPYSIYRLRGYMYNIFIYWVPPQRIEKHCSNVNISSSRKLHGSIYCCRKYCLYMKRLKKYQKTFQKQSKF